MMITYLLIACIALLTLIVGVLLFDRRENRKVIKTQALEMGNYILTVSNGEISLKPKEK